MKIRIATKNDYKQLMELYNDFVGENRYLNYNNDSFTEVINSKNNYVYIAEELGKFVGFASFSVRFVIRYPKPIAELDELFVASLFRKKGVGKKLLDKIIDKAKKLNCHRLYIESAYDRKEAHIFYEILGFKNYGYHFIKDL